MIEFKLPDIGEGMHEGEIIQWLIKEGEPVRQDQPVLEVQTDKVNAELTAPATGIITKLFYKEGDTVEVGATLFTLQDQKGSSAPEIKPVIGAPAEKAETNAARPPETATSHALATPFVRQLAREMNIDLQLVKGTGPAGRITERDLQQYTQGGTAPAASPESADLQAASPSGEETEERMPLKGIRKKIAEHMVKSVTAIPHVTHVDELEMDALCTLKDQLKRHAEEKNIKLTFLPFFVKAIVVALKEFPIFNASIDTAANEIILKKRYHIGIATDTEEGLLVPVIKHADQKSIFQLAAEIRQLAAKAREGSLKAAQITGSTFTISNAGGIGGLHATPIINHPEAAILALHKMEPRMVVRNQEGVIRSMMNMSLSFDHRLIDGVTAVRFTNRIKELLENPTLLWMEMR
ncbi:MAG: dihydrolipoamide acetyltransferase family protein [Bacillus sp. (in: firmicutes)]